MSEELVAFFIPKLPCHGVASIMKSCGLLAVLFNGVGIVTIQIGYLILVEEQLNDFARFRDIREVLVADDDILYLFKPRMR